MNSDTTDHATLTLAAREDAALLAATMLIAAKRYMADAEAYRAWALRNLAATEEDAPFASGVRRCASTHGVAANDITNAEHRSTPPRVCGVPACSTMHRVRGREP